MKMESLRKWMLWTLILCMSAFATARVEALDYNDVKNLLANNVSEQVIANMLNQQDGRMEITEAQAGELRQLGASDTLLAAMNRVATQPVTSGDSWTYVGGDGTVYSAGDIPSGIVQQAPQATAADSSGTVYYDPNVTYYNPSAPVVVSPAPTVIYETPTYVEVPTYVYPSVPRRSSSFNFSIGIGGGKRGHYRGRPGRHHRW